MRDPQPVRDEQDKLTREKWGKQHPPLDPLIKVKSVENECTPLRMARNQHTSKSRFIQNTLISLFPNLCEQYTKRFPYKTRSIRLSFKQDDRNSMPTEYPETACSRREDSETLWRLSTIHTCVLTRYGFSSLDRFNGKRGGGG